MISSSSAIKRSLSIWYICIRDSIWANPYEESESLGTDLYDNDFKLVKTIKYLHNNGYFFSSGQDTWHGLELKEIKKERRCIQINYVSFETEWPVNK